MINPLYEASLSSFSTQETRTQDLSLSARYNFKPNLFITAQGSLLTAKGTVDDFVSPLSMQFKDVTDPLKKGKYTLSIHDENNYSFKVVGNWIHSFDNDGTLFTLNVGGEIKKQDSSSRTSVASGFLSDLRIGIISLILRLFFLRAIFVIYPIKNFDDCTIPPIFSH